MNILKRHNEENLGRALALQTLERNGISGHPVDVRRICAREGVKLVRYSSFAGGVRAIKRERNTGLYRTLIELFGSIPPYGASLLNYIFYNECAGGVGFTIAHELGHILMGHTTQRTGGYNVEEHLRKREEHEANSFAAQLLASGFIFRLQAE